jgi:hypothetical protein
MGYLFVSGLGERYVREDEDDEEEERGPVSGFAGTPTLADLRDFCRPELKAIQKAGKALDCADLAIELWIRFGARHGIATPFKVWDAAGKAWKTVKRSDFKTVAGFVAWVQSNVGALGLQSNTFALRKGHRTAKTGDVYLDSRRYADPGVIRTCCPCIQHRIC